MNPQVVRIIQPDNIFADSEREKLPSTTIHTLLTLAKLVQTMQSQLHEEKQDDPQAISPSPTNPSAPIPVEPANFPAAKSDQSFAGTSVDAVFGDQAVDTPKGGAA